jgi:hypothetical protein
MTYRGGGIYLISAVVLLYIYAYSVNFITCTNVYLKKKYSYVNMSSWALDSLIKNDGLYSPVAKYFGTCFKIGI